MRTMIMVLLFTPLLALASDAITNYKAVYKATIIDKMKPELTKQWKSMGKTDAEIASRLDYFGSSLAECQIKLLNTYDTKYKDKALAVVAAGGGILESNAEVEAMMKEDMTSGRKTEQQVVTQVENAIRVMRSCSQAIK